MFDRVLSKLEDCPVAKDITPDRYSPAEGVIYFRLETDDEGVSPQLRDIQPESSTIVVEDGEIVEYDVRLGSWNPSDRDAAMERIEEQVTAARRESYVPPVRIDRGGGGRFVPHVRMMNGRVAEEPFMDFLTALAAEVGFLQSHGTATEAAA